jgi:NADH-quinone oxidoreductase subunit A
LESYVPVLLMAAAAVAIAGGVFTLTTKFGPKNYTAEKMEPYESGWETTGSQGIRLSVKFYLTAILFVVFDVESVFLYPWAIRFRELGWVGFWTMLAFLAVLGLAVLYVFRKGALEWEK